MLDGKFVFKNARLSKVVIKRITYSRDGHNFEYTFRKSGSGTYALCQIGNLLHQPTTTLDMARYASFILDNDFCSASIEKEDRLVIRIKKSYRFNPFLVMNNEYVAEWGRLYNGLVFVFKALITKGVLHGGFKYKPDHSYMAAHTLDSIFQRVLDPVNRKYLDRLALDLNLDDVELDRYSIQNIAATCLFQVSIRNILSYIRGIQNASNNKIARHAIRD